MVLIGDMPIHMIIPGSSAVRHFVDVDEQSYLLT